MRQRRTRWGAVVLAVAMVLSLLTISAAAAEGADTWDGKAVDTDWYDASEDSFTLTSAAQLAGLAKLVNGGTNFSGKTVSLDKDIDLAGHEWTPIGKSGSTFQGTFDGQNHTISNLVVDQPYKNDVGFFGYTTNGAVRNFTLENAAVTGYLDVGAVAGTPYTSAYSNIRVTGAVQVEGFAYVGGAFGKNVYEDITNVDVLADEGSYVRADSVAYRTYVGGLVGFMGEGSITVQDCNVEIDVTGSTCDVGGILGILHYGNTLKDCTYRGSLTLTDPDVDQGDEFGALAGVVNNGGYATTITGCTATVVQATAGGEDVTETLRPFGDFYYAVGSADDNGSVTVDATVNDKPFTASNNAARIDDEEYKTLSAAVAAAKPGETVELLNDVTEATWNQIWNITGITLEGNGHTLTVEQIVSGQNHDALFHSAGGNTFQNLTIDLTKLEAPAVAAQGTRAFSAAAGDAFYDVKILGCENLSYGITVSGTQAGQEETITIDGCRFEDCGYGVYSDEVTNLEKLVIHDCVFEDCGYATILYTEETEFTGNTVYGGKLNILHEQQIVTDNIFADGSRIKFYEDPAQFVRNQISSDSCLDAAEGVKDVNVAENYWGGGAPSEEQCGGVDVVGTDIYYKSPDMDEGDLNTDRAVTLVYNNGEQDRTVYVTAGDAYTLPEKPAKRGYTFLGWKSSADREVYKAGDRVKIYEDTTFTAQWMSNWEIVGDIAGAAGAGQEFFTDVNPGDWYYDAVKFVFDNNLMDGVGDGKFDPDGTLTRAMIAQVLYNLEGETGSYPTVFDDVAKSAWYADAVNWAAASGIVEGKGNGKFDPNAAITRQEMAAILYRYSDLKGYDVSDVDSLAAFTDADKVASWAKEAMGWAVENYVINGKGNGKLDPTGTATRAEVAQILMNLCNNVL